MDADKSPFNPTKPNNLTKERKKPLRTYGKRTVFEKESGPSAKRRKANPGESTGNGADGQTGPSLLPDIATADSFAITCEDGTGHPDYLPPTKPAIPKKGSILSYFKPEPAPSSASPSDCSSTSIEENSTPPSAPVPSEIRRVPRRLTTRPILTEDPDTSIDSQERSLRLSLSSIASSRKRTRANKAVQTTLNLSLQGDLTECRICGMLYNSVHPKDVKLHSMGHAAILKQRELRQNTEQDD